MMNIIKEGNIVSRVHKLLYFVNSGVVLGISKDNVCVNIELQDEDRRGYPVYSIYLIPKDKVSIASGDLEEEVNKLNGLD